MKAIHVLLLFGMLLIGAVQTSPVVYVSPSGSDSNPGTLEAPFLTFERAFAAAGPGWEIVAMAGVYPALNVTEGGTADALLKIRGLPGAVIDAMGANAALNIGATIKYLYVSGFQVRGSNFDNVLVRGSHITLDRLDVYGAQKFGVRLRGQYIAVRRSFIHGNVLENEGGVMGNAGGWGAALRTGPGSAQITLLNNEIAYNWGEGIILGDVNGAVARGNRVHDNYSVDIYLTTSTNLSVERNLVFNSDPTYYRSGRPANCITAGQETGTTMTGLKNVRVINNIVSTCKYGLGYTYTEVTDNGCDGCLFAFNTVMNSWGIKVISGPRNHVVIKNNALNSGAITVPSGQDIVLGNNYIGVLGLAGGAIDDAQAYRPLADSPLIGYAVDIGIYTDYFSNARSGPMEAGAVEVESIPPPTPTDTPTPSPTVTPTPSPTPACLPPTGA